MKKLSWKLVLPLTIISFVMVTKWWYVDFIDGHDQILTGFPLPYMTPGLHTSLSLQIFVMELTVDIIVYLIFWFLIVYLLHKLIKPIKIPKYLTISLLSISGVISFFLILIAINPDNIWKTKRENDMEIFDSGFEFIWQERITNNYDKLREKIDKKKGERTHNNSYKQ